MIISSRYGDEFGKRIFEEMRKYKENVKHLNFIYRIFPDDESIVRFSDPPIYSIRKGEVLFLPTCEKSRKEIEKDGQIVFVNRGASGKNWKPVHEFCNALFATNYLKNDMGAERVCIILPNMPFAKQDKIFYDNEGRMVDGQPITVKQARKILKEVGVDLLISITPHDFRKTGWIIKDEDPELGWRRNEKNQIIDSEGKVILPEPEDWTNFAYAIDVMPEVVEYVFSNLDNPFVVGGDRSVEKAVRMVKEKYNVNGTYSEKFRDRYWGNINLSIDNLPPDLSAYDIVLLDDVIITAGTMKKAIQIIKQRNPKSITCAAVHGEFSYNKEGKSGLDVLREEGANVVVTNTIETPVSFIDITPKLAEKLYEIYK